LNAYLPIGPLKKIDFFRNTFLELIIKFQNNSLANSIFNLDVKNETKIGNNNENINKNDIIRKSSSILNKKHRNKNNNDDEPELKKSKIKDKGNIIKQNSIYNHKLLLQGDYEGGKNSNSNSNYNNNNNNNNNNEEEEEEEEDSIVTLQIPTDVYAFINKNLLSEKKYYDFNKITMKIIRIIYFNITNHNNKCIPLDSNININGGYLSGYKFHPVETMDLIKIEFNNWFVDDGRLGLINLRFNREKHPICETTKETKINYILIQDKYNSQQWYQIVQPDDNYKKIYKQSTVFFQYFIKILKLARIGSECDCFELLELNKRSDRKLIEYNENMIINYLIKLGYDKNSKFLTSLSTSSSLVSNQNNSIVGEFTNNRMVDNEDSSDSYKLNTTVIDTNSDVIMHDNNMTFLGSTDREIERERERERGIEIDRGRDREREKNIYKEIDKDIDRERDKDIACFTSSSNISPNTSQPNLHFDPLLVLGNTSTTAPVVVMRNENFNSEEMRDDDLEKSRIKFSKLYSRLNSNNKFKNPFALLVSLPLVTIQADPLEEMRDDDLEKSRIKFSKLYSTLNSKIHFHH
jgi:hypothetical protein